MTACNLQHEQEFQKQQAKELMQQGVTFADPARFDLRGTVKLVMMFVLM